MQEHLGFLKVSSAVVKVAAWIFLFFGVIGGIALLTGIAPQHERWMGWVILALYSFLFFFLFFVGFCCQSLNRLPSSTSST